MKRIGECIRCGECCINEQSWKKYFRGTDLFVTGAILPCCPFLDGQEGDKERLCRLYDTDKHWVWVDYCSNAPGLEMEVEQVLSFFESCPSCSYEYIEE